MNYIFQHKQVQSSFGSFFAEIAQPNSSMFELKSHLLINAKNTQTVARPRKSHQHKCQDHPAINIMNQSPS